MVTCCRPFAEMWIATHRQRVVLFYKLWHLHCVSEKRGVSLFMITLSTVNHSATKLLRNGEKYFIYFIDIAFSNSDRIFKIS